MVQTLSGSWWMWLVPLFILSLLIMIPASLSELGINPLKRKKEEPAAAEKVPAVPAEADSAVSPAEESDEDELLQVVLMAAAAYIETENKRGGNDMRNLKITVNGKTYDVTVEEEGKSYEYAPRFSERRPAAPAAKPAVQAVKPAAPAPEVKAAPVQAPEAPKAVSGDGVKLEAPMSGRVVEIVAPVGTAVKAGDPVIVMEAMKLQSEICAETSGTVKQILVKEKQDITTGEAVAVIG